jgi:import inner membrane translocase subunit TIM44
MNSLRLSSTRVPLNASLNSIIRPSGRAATSKLLQYAQSSTTRSLSSNSSIETSSIYAIPLRSKFLPDEVRTGFGPAASRRFHSGNHLRQEKDANPTKQGTEETLKNPKAGAAEESKNHSQEDKSKEESEEDGKKEDKKEAPPPPPPHGDKSPWQVFTETLQSEFKASKEWNESTKALAAGAQQFTENESVRRAREAYTSTTGAVSSTAGTVLKSTAGAVGKGAAWTWETPVVKGVRTTVNATASVIEKGTRPIRETEAFKNVKNVIDDGSSSRYGGWVEKEERRKARELREMQAGGGKRVEVAKEDPE